MTDAVDLTSLLKRPEGETLDFKATNYNLSNQRKKRDFAKDVASLANTPRDGDAYIVLGVKKRLDGTFELWGIDNDIDDGQLQSVASSLLDSVPRFVYEVIPHESVDLGLITIQVGQATPAVPKKTEDPGFVKDEIYFRRGSQNDVATIPEQGRIWDWLRGDIVNDISSNPYAEEPAWSCYLAAVGELNSGERHILVADDRFQEETSDLSGIGAGPWGFVFDFDTKSDVDGLLSSIRGGVERRRALHMRVKGDQHTSRSPDFTTTWFFMRGLEGRAESLVAGSIRNWMRSYRLPLAEECERLARELTPATVYVTILWRDGEFNDHLRELLLSLDTSLHDSLKPVFVTEARMTCQSLAVEFDAPVIEMPFHQFALGIQQHVGQKQSVDPGTVTLPSTSGVNIPLEPQTANWIAEEIELVSLGLPRYEEDNVDTFLRGGTASWADLDRNVDARRDVQSRLTDAVRNDLESGRTTRINLFHRPGAGGTTVARRVAWELHEKFPSGLLRRTNPMETAERVARIYELTERPVLLIVDGADVSERELDDLAEYLGARRTPVVLVQVRRRRSGARQQGARTFEISSELSNSEIGRFVSALSRDVPYRATAIERFARHQTKSLHRPVYFALTAYERDFRALPDFVSSRIDGLNDDQKRVLVYAAIALRYGQRAFPSSALRAVFGLNPSSPIDVPSLFPATTEELFVETEVGAWRIGHSLVADELLQQMLATGADHRTWPNRLADWGVSFIEFCRGRLPVPSDEMLALVRGVFIFRDDRDVLGREQSVQRRFSHFIEDIPFSESRVRVLEALVGSYPEEHHFWAHLARFHAVENKDFTRALEAADHAVDLSDRDSVVYHMRGMVRRNQITELRRDNVAVDELVAIAQQASSDFEYSRTLNPENEHGYIAEVQMLIDVLGYVSEPSGDLFQFLTRTDIHPYLREALDRIEGLLAHVKRDREGVGSSEYEARASARVRELYGDYAGALQQLDSLLSRPDIYQPPIRRQLAWAYLNRADGDWSQVPIRNVSRVVDLLARNLREEYRGDQNIRLWMQASRFLTNPPSLDDIFEQVQYWGAEPGSVDAKYYAYVLNGLMAMDGAPLALQRHEQYLEECRELTRFRRKRDHSYEWLGEGRGIAKLVNQSRLGQWDRERDFWGNPSPLKRIRGRVARIVGPQAGFVEFDGGLMAFFVPHKSSLSSGSENTPVLAYLGFSYDGPRAWDIKHDEER